MQYIPSALLLIESILSFYKYFSPKSLFGPSFLDLIFGVIFIFFAYIIFKNPKNRAWQWAVIIISLLLGPGGFIGFGGLIALGLAISFILISKQSVSSLK